MNDTQAHQLKKELLAECVFAKTPSDDKIYPVIISASLGSGLFIAKDLIDNTSKRQIKKFAKDRGLKIEKIELKPNTKEGYKIFKGLT